MASDTAAWVEATRAALLADAPAVEFCPATPPTWQQAHLPEYRRRLLRIAAACAGWSRATVAPLWPWIAWASDAFECGDRDRWRAALAELERYTGVAP